MVIKETAGSLERSEIVAPSFEILFCGPFSREDVIVSDTQTVIERPKEVRNRIAEIWRKAVDSSKSLEDRENVLLLAREQKVGGLLLRLGRGRYRDYYAFRSDGQLLRKHPELVPQLFTVATLLQTLDGYLVLNQRSDKVFRFQGWLASLGGSVDTTDVDEQGRIDPFIAARREVSEEVGIDESTVSDVECLGFMRDRNTGIEVMLFVARTSLTKDWIQKEQHGDSWEGESLFVRVDQEEVRKVALWYSSVLVSDAAALLVLFGKGEFGDSWLDYTTQRLHRRGRVYESLGSDQLEEIRGRRIERLTIRKGD